MSPVLLVMVLAAALLGLIPVWRLRVAGWPTRWLVLAWIGYSASIFLAVRAPMATRFLLPILVLAYVAPFIAGPERLSRVLRRPPEPPRPIIDVTPQSGLPAEGDDARPDDEGGTGMTR